MFYPFKVSDPFSGLQYRLNDIRLAELSLAPRPKVWAPHPIIKAAPDPVWAESFANGPAETASAVIVALEDLILTTPDLAPSQIALLPEARTLAPELKQIALGHIALFCATVGRRKLPLTIKWLYQRSKGASHVLSFSGV